MVARCKPDPGLPDWIRRWDGRGRKVPPEQIAELWKLSRAYGVRAQMHEAIQQWKANPCFVQRTANARWSIGSKATAKSTCDLEPVLASFEPHVQSRSNNSAISIPGLALLRTCAEALHHESGSG